MNDELQKNSCLRLPDLQRKLTISREALVKIGKHAWNAYPLEAFGYLLGRNTDNTVSVALPCSKTGNWYKFEDRWQGIEENIDHAIATARLFDLSVVGCYASCEAFATVDNYPPPPIISKANLSLRVLYQTCCCPGHSWVSILAKDKRLIRGENFQISPGKRSDKYINQKRILKAWSQFHGTIDYSNRPTFSEVSSAILANAD
jgi:hypothetical protein